MFLPEEGSQPRFPMFPFSIPARAGIRVDLHPSLSWSDFLPGRGFAGGDRRGNTEAPTPLRGGG